MAKKKAKKTREQYVAENMEKMKQPGYMPIRVVTRVGDQFRQLVEQLDRAWEKFSLRVGPAGGVSMEQMLAATQSIEQLLRAMNDVAASLSHANNFKFYRPPRGLPKPQLIPQIAEPPSKGGNGARAAADAATPPASAREESETGGNGKDAGAEVSVSTSPM